MNKSIIIIIIILVVIIGGYFLFRGGYQAPPESGTQPQSGVPAPGQDSVSEKVVAPSETEEQVPSVNEISLTSGNLFFSPKTLTLTKGQPVRITIKNTGTHTFTIDELGVNVSLRGSSATVEFTPNLTGTFEYYCAVPGHRSAGMEGSLNVK